VTHQPILLRRVYLALTGLVPTPAQIAEFKVDKSGTAYENAVDKLLKSDAFAEHLALDWMDVARYADSYGYQVDRGRTTWYWRDWVINAFKQNMTYDQFILQQLAGDIMLDSDDQMKLATAFNRLHGMKVEGGSVEEEFRTEYIFDRVQTAGTAFLGLTMECTRCHDHKYDPVTMKDFYSMAAFFNNIDESGLLAYFNQSVPSPTLILMQDNEKAEVAKRATARDQAAAAHQTAMKAEAKAFKEWKNTWDGTVRIQGAVAHYSFDEIKNGQVSNDYHMPDVSDPGGGMIETHGLQFVLKHPDFAKQPVSQIRIALPGNKRILSVAEVEVWSGGKNVVKNAKFKQSSEYNNGQFPAKLLADGDKRNFTHTAESRNPWLMISFKEPVSIDEVKLWNRIEVPERLHDAAVTFTAGKVKVAEMKLKIPGGAGGMKVRIAGKGIDDGLQGKALHFDGDTKMSLGQLGPFARHDDFSFSIGIKPSAAFERAVIMHRSKAWTDAGSRGYELMVHEGKIDFALIHFAPGNEIRVRTKRDIPVNKWTRVTMTYDGSGEAAGIKLYFDGVQAETEIVKDYLTKEIFYSSAKKEQVQLAARMRDKGFKNSGIDEVAFFDRALTALEVREQHQPGAKAKNDDELQAYYLAAHSLPVRKAFDDLTAKRKAYDEYLDGRIRMMIMKEMPERRKTYVLKRGLYSDPDPDQEMQPAPPEKIFPFGPEFSRDRLGFAKWLVHPEHPLTSRVTVNRYWQMLFGQGLVVTTEDFGFQGALPTHPGLLDYLSRYFIDNGWDVRKLMRHIVTSHTFRQSSRGPTELTAKDPDNKLLARGPSFHMTAEMLRDSAMHAGGKLALNTGGGSTGLTSNRRSLYVSMKRNAPPDEMITFGAARRQVCTVKREKTATPLQPLVLMNSPLYVRGAKGVADAVLANKANKDDASKLQDLFQRLTGRTLAVEELDVLTRLLKEQREYFGGSPEVSQNLGKVSGAGRGSPELSAWTVVAGAVMNLDAFYMVR
jgi:hypothetical protein